MMENAGGEKADGADDEKAVEAEQNGPAARAEAAKKSHASF